MNIFKKISLFIFLVITLFINSALTVQAEKKPPVQFTPQVGIPDSEFQTGVKVDTGVELKTTTSTILKSDLIGRYIFAVYNWMLGIVGVIALLTIMAAGLLWLTSGGDSSKITKAKELIIGSISGIALTIGAWFLLNTINPNLTKMSSIDFELVEKVDATGCCEVNGKGSKSNNTKCAGTFFPNSTIISDGACDKPVCCIDTTYSSSRTCFDTYSSNCSSSFFYPGESSATKFKSVSGSCKDVGECSGQTVSCVDVSVGGDCDGTNKDCWCYNNMAYFNKFGKDQEPCGDEKYSKCTSKDGTLDLGSRSCGENLWCRKFNEDGTIK